MKLLDKVSICLDFGRDNDFPNLRPTPNLEKLNHSQRKISEIYFRFVIKCFEFLCATIQSP